MAGFGNTQIINGQSYEMYTPAWYDAMHAEAQRAAKAAGTAQGTALGAASAAAGVPIGSSSSSSSGTTSSSSGSGTSASGSPASVAYPNAALAGLTAAAGGSGGAVPGGVAGSGSAHLAPVDTSAAEAATFNRAKDQVGETASGALTGLRSALGARGMLGSGLEGVGTAMAATSAAGELGDVTRQSAITKAELDNKNATTNFEGGIQQRGQDFQREEAANSLAGEDRRASYAGQITQRGQDIQNANAQKALEMEQAQLNSQQRSTALAGLEAALKVTSPSGMMY